MQHLWAEFSEKLSDVVDPTIKYGGGESAICSLLSEMSATIGAFEELEFKHSGVDYPEQLEPLKENLSHLLRYAIARSEIIGGKDAISD